ncbi:hypothetical protein ABW19_dt0203123 [Dactylella cylindrospora]|nr:hypothetical protein ABW19_dt0203123 [Dactylella cylindrospora]
MTPDLFKQKALESLKSFDPGLILRGAQLTFVGAYRALQNPNLFHSQHYKQAALAVLVGVLVKILVDIPILGVKIVLMVSGWFADLKTAGWDDQIIRGIGFIEKNVLQIPFFLTTYTSWYLTNALDDMFMESLQWVDQTYVRKHANENPGRLRGLFYPTLVLWEKGSRKHSKDQSKLKHNTFIHKMVKKGAVSLLVYFSSLVPILGRFVLPAASAYSLHPVAGIGPSLAVFAVGLFVPRRNMVIALQAYYSSRSLVRQLLEPYFSRIYFTDKQKKRWFRERQGLLLGFGLGFYLLSRIPFIGVLVYGIAEASTAYLITKITDPPPNPSQGTDFAESQVEWKSKTDFVKLSWDSLDRRFGQDLVDHREREERIRGTKVEKW